MEHIPDTSVVVYVTEDYSRFKVLDANRAILPLHVKKLAASLLKKNLLKYRPILVNEKMQVLDGQHTLQGAMLAKERVWYVIAVGMELQDIYLIQTTRKDWVLANHFHFWAALGNDLFKKIMDFCRTNRLTVTNFLSLSGADSGRHFDKIRQGIFRINADEVFPFILEKLQYIKTVVDKVKIHAKHEVGKAPPHEYAESLGFTKALTLLLDCKAFNRELFLKKIVPRSHKIRHCGSIGEYFEMFKEIHNTSNPDPIYIGSKDLKREVRRGKKKRPM